MPKLQRAKIQSSRKRAYGFGDYLKYAKRDKPKASGRFQTGSSKHERANLQLHKQSENTSLQLLTARRGDCAGD